MKSSESIAAIAPALVAALNELGGVQKDSTNPHFKSAFASLEAVIDASKPILAKHDLAIMQGGGSYVSGALATTTRIIHTSGEWIESTMEIPLAKADPQGAGSAVSYGRRYALMALLNMPAVDDDGQAATHNKPAAVQQGFQRKSAAQSKRDGDDTRIKAEIEACPTELDLNRWYADFDKHTAHIPASWLDPVRDMVESRRNDIIEQLHNERAA